MMRAMILAAGKGSRLKPLTDHCPKPLVKVAGKPLIVYHLERLKLAGIDDIVINVFYLAEKIIRALGNGQAFGLNIAYSHEPSLLEVGGGIAHALPLLGKEPFAIINGDIWTDYDFSRLPTMLSGKGHLIVVDNPIHHPQGDFALQSNGQLCKIAAEQPTGAMARAYTYSGVAMLSPDLFTNTQVGQAFRLAPLFDKAINEQNLTGEYFSGAWTDVGTLERLRDLEHNLLLS